MDWLTESPAYTGLGPQLMGVKVLEICAGVLLLLAILTFIIGWARHLSMRMWLLAFVPLAVGIATGIIAHALHDTYVYWVYYFGHITRLAPVAGERIDKEFANANQTAVVLAWVFVFVTGVLLVLSLLSWWRLVVSRGQRHRSTSIALNSHEGV